MTYCLLPSIHAAVCGDDLVLLNVENGAYSCLPGCGPMVGLRAAAGELDLLDDELAAVLQDAGAVVPGRGSQRFLAPAPSHSLAYETPHLFAEEALAMARALGWVARHYWRAPFGRLISSASEAALATCGDLARIEHLTRAFQAMLPWVPRQGVCLYRSFYLLAFLRLHGVSASWVFGVQTFPLEAHCWLQAGELVLDDDVEHARGLTPILALEP